MPLTEPDMLVLKTIALYYLLTREQIQRLCNPAHASGRGTRKQLLRLRQAGLIIMHRMQITLPGMNGAAPVYYVTKKGAEALASYFGDDCFLATNTKHPRADRLAHWVAINDTRMLVEAAAERLENVTLVSWITEWETINKDDTKTAQFCLHTQLSETPPLSCSPDAAFLIECKGQRKVHYLEQDRATSSPRQIAARKSKGYAKLAQLKGHHKHFPDTTLDSFRVLFFTTNDYRAKKTREEMQSKPGKELWLMVNQSQVTATNLFTGDIAIDHEGTIGPLIRAAPADGDSPNQDTDRSTTSPHVAVPAPTK